MKTDGLDKIELLDLIKALQNGIIKDKKFDRASISVLYPHLDAPMFTEDGIEIGLKKVSDGSRIYTIKVYTK